MQSENGFKHLNIFKKKNHRFKIFNIRTSVIVKTLQLLPQLQQAQAGEDLAQETASDDDDDYYYYYYHHNYYYYHYY